MDASNKRILKNTLLLYVRMIVVLAVNLYTVRLVLQALGFVDNGIFQVVGGIVSLFTIINGALSSGSSRFITFALGTNDKVELQKIFSASFVIHLCMAVIILILLESIGLWYINNIFKAPADRMFAVNIVFQVSVFTSILSVTQVPYTALIIAYERIDIFAYVGLVEVFFKLLLVILLLNVDNVDKLIVYALLLLLWNIIAQFFYRNYCYKKYKESHLKLIKDKSIYKKMLAFSFWDVIGIFTVQGNVNGVNAVINYFFGLIYNTAFGLANQISSYINQFINNFMTAVGPQITKYYAENNLIKAHSLILNSSKMSYLLYAIVAIPFFYEAEFVIGIWLDEIPAKLVLFVKLLIIVSLIRSMARPIVIAVHATGNIKYLNIYPGFLSVLLTIPLTYILYKNGLHIESTLYVSMFIAILSNFLELYCLKKEDKEFNVRHYIYTVYVKISAVVIFIFCILYIFTSNVKSSFIRVLETSSISLFFFILLSFLFILTKEQKSAIQKKITSIFFRVK